MVLKVLQYCSWGGVRQVRPRFFLTSAVLYASKYCGKRLPRPFFGPKFMYGVKAHQGLLNCPVSPWLVYTIAGVVIFGVVIGYCKVGGLILYSTEVVCKLFSSSPLKPPRDILSPSYYTAGLPHRRLMTCLYVASLPHRRLMTCLYVASLPHRRLMTCLYVASLPHRRLMTCLYVASLPHRRLMTCLYVASLPLSQWPTPSVIVIIIVFFTVFIIVTVFVSSSPIPCPWGTLIFPFLCNWTSLHLEIIFLFSFSTCVFEVCNIYEFLTQFILCIACPCFVSAHVSQLIK
jgi:hypothetical protein